MISDSNGKKVAWRKKNRCLKNDTDRETAVRRFATACIRSEQTSIAERCPQGIVLENLGSDTPPPTPETNALTSPGEVEIDGCNVSIQATMTTPLVETAVDAYDIGQLDFEGTLLEICAKQKLNETLITRECARADRAEQELQRLKTVLSEHSSMLAVSNQTAIHVLPIQQQMVKTFTSEKQKILEKISEMESLCLAVSAAGKTKSPVNQPVGQPTVELRNHLYDDRNVELRDFKNYLSPRNIKTFNDININVTANRTSFEKKPSQVASPRRPLLSSPTELLHRMTHHQIPVSNKHDYNKHQQTTSKQLLLTPEFVSAHTSANKFNHHWRLKAFPEMT